MPLAGETIIAGKVPGERIATDIETSNGSAIGTTETVVMTVVAPVVTGRVYKVSVNMALTASVASDDCQINMREDTVSGTLMQADVIDAPIVNRIPRVVLEAEYTADATEDKTFVVTIDRVAGSGTFTLTASANRPAYLYVDFIRES